MLRYGPSTLLSPYSAQTGLCNVIQEEEAQ